MRPEPQTEGTYTLDALRGQPLRRAMGFATVAWMFGSVWMNGTAGAPFTNFATGLRPSNFQFGLLAALPFIASFLTLPASLLTEATGQRKRIFLWGLYCQRLMWFPIALFPLWLVNKYGLAAGTTRAMTLFLTLVFIMHVGQAVGGPAWVSWMSDIVPDRMRGKYFSTRRQMGLITAVPAALFVGWLLDRYVPAAPAGASAEVAAASTQHMLGWCAAIFMGAAAFGVMDIFLFQFVPDIPKEPQLGKKLLKSWREPLRNPQFLWFAGFVATLVFAVSFMGQFVTLYVMEAMQGMKGNGGGLHTNSLTQIMVIVAPGIAQMVVLPVWGRAADRMGKRPLLILAALGLVPVGIGWSLVDSNHIWIGYLLSAGGAALWTGVETANFNLTLEMCDLEDGGGGTSYVAMNAVIINTAGCLGGLASGVIAQWLRDWHWQTSLKTFTFYDVLFALSASLRLLAVVVFLPHVKEPASRPTREALRFIAANIYNNLFTAALQPLRFLGLSKKESYVEADESN